MLGRQHVLAQPFMQSLEPPTGAAKLAGERGSFRFDPVAREDQARDRNNCSPARARAAPGGAALLELTDRTEFATRPNKGQIHNRVSS
jgi:hypothetical protein